MHPLLIAFLAALLVNVVSAYTCPYSDVTVKYQGQPYFFPPQGADDHYASNQNCSWIIQVPDGYYAKWGFNVNLHNSNESNPDMLKTVIEFGDIGDISYYFDSFDLYTDTLSDQIGIYLKSHDGANGTFRFNVTWLKEVPPATPVVTNVDEFGYNVIKLWELNDQNVATFAIGNDEQISLATDCADWDALTDVLVYDGFTVSGPHKNMEDAIFAEMASSVNHAYTLYNPIRNAPLENCIAIANDARDTSQFDFYTVIYNFAGADGYNTMQATPIVKKPQGLTYVAAEGVKTTLYDIAWLESLHGELLAFNGVPNPVSIGSPDFTFTQDAGNSQFPFTFDSTVVTFVLHKGAATLQTSPSTVMAPKAVSVLRSANSYAKTIDNANSGRVVKTVYRKNS